MQMCPECDEYYDESEYAKCPYCHGGYDTQEKRYYIPTENPGEYLEVTEEEYEQWLNDQPDD